MTYPIIDPNHHLQSILKEIVWHKKQEIAQIQQEMSLASVQRQLTAAPTVRDFLTALQQSHYQPALIPEVKKASPNQGIIRADFDPVAMAQAYERGGATCISVFSDQKFFQGGFDQLRAIRQRVSVPLLCKDFILDPCQIYLARAAGADAVLLIAALLCDREIVNFMRVIHYLGMNALVEVHSLAELDRILKLEDIRLIAINNQSLEDFSVDTNILPELVAARYTHMQNLGILIVGEPGLYTPADLSLMTVAGIDAVVLGEPLLQQNDLTEAVRSLLHLDTSNSHKKGIKVAVSSSREKVG